MTPDETRGQDGKRYPAKRPTIVAAVATRTPLRGFSSERHASNNAVMHSTQLVVRVPTDLAEAFARASRRHERTVSAGVRLAMRQHLEELEQREKFESMSLDELDTYLAGVDDGREDGRPARGERGAVKPRAQVAGHET